MKKKLLGTLLTVALAAGLLAGCNGDKTATDNTDVSEASGDETADNDGSAEDGITATTLNIAVQPSGAFIPLLVVRENGWLEEALAPYGVTVTWNDFESGPPINESMASDLSDVGAIGDVPTVSAIAAGQDNQVALIAAEGTRAYAILVAADSDISSIADLKGKNLGTTLGSTGHSLFEMALATENLTFDDVNLINISAGDAGSVLSTGEIDAVAIWEPNITRLIENGTARVLTYGGEVGLLGVNPIVVDSKYAAENPKIIDVLIEQYKRGVEESADLNGETLTNLAAYLSLTEDQVITVASNWDYTVEITQDDIDGLQKTIQFLVTIGNLSEEYQISDYIRGN